MAQESNNLSQSDANVKSLGLNPVVPPSTAAKEIYERGRTQTFFDKGMEDFIDRMSSQREGAAYSPIEGARYAPIAPPFSQSFQSSNIFSQAQHIQQDAQPSMDKKESPFHPFKVTLNADSEAIVEPDSRLFRSLSYTNTETISGLGSAMPVSDGDSIWLEIEFTTWPSVYTATIKAGDFSATAGEVEDDAGSPPIQTFSRIVLATFESDGSGGVKVKDQLVRNNLQMKMFLVGGLPVNYPVAKP